MKERLARDGKFSFAQTAAIMTPVLKTLAAVHKAGMIHRDISPDNIFLCENGKVKLLDFGAARIAENEEDKSRSIVLKHGYAPKEQYTSRGQQGPFTDIYAVSATMYKMLTGLTPVESLERLDDEDPLQDISYLADLPADAAQAIMQGMAVNSKDRVQSAETLLQRLTASAPQSASAGASAPAKSRKADLPGDATVTLYTPSTAAQELQEQPVGRNEVLPQQPATPPVKQVPPKKEKQPLPEKPAKPAPQPKAVKEKPAPQPKAVKEKPAPAPKPVQKARPARPKIGAKAIGIAAAAVVLAAGGIAAAVLIPKHAKAGIETTIEAAEAMKTYAYSENIVTPSLQDITVFPTEATTRPTTLPTTTLPAVSRLAPGAATVPPTTTKPAIAFNRGYTESNYYYNTWANIKVKIQSDWIAVNSVPDYPNAIFMETNEDGADLIEIWGAKGTLKNLMRTTLDLSEDEYKEMFNESKSVKIAGTDYLMFEEEGYGTQSVLDPLNIFQTYAYTRAYFKEINGAAIIIIVYSEEDADKLDQYAALISAIE